MAITSMVLGIVGVVGGYMCLGLMFPVAAVILGHIAYSNISKHPTELTGKGFAIAGFTTGYVGLLLGIIIALMFGTLAAGMATFLEAMNQAMGQGARP